MSRQNESLRITSAPMSKREDINSRARRYLIAMGLRVACFIAAVLAIGTPMMWVFIVGAIFLPYFAVIMANSTNKHTQATSEYAYNPEFTALTEAPDERSRRAS